LRKVTAVTYYVSHLYSLGETEEYLEKYLQLVDRDSETVPPVYNCHGETNMPDDLHGQRGHIVEVR
jgi:hypothetical protein